MREIDLEIAGQRLHLRTDEDEAYMRRLATFVEEQMREVGKGQQRGIASMTVALLAALRIADEYHKVKSLEESVDSALSQLADAVESCLDGSPRRTSFRDPAWIPRRASRPCVPRRPRCATRSVKGWPD